MIETPIVSMPYHRMVFYIVGPLKRTKQGYSHILTAMCMGTNYPYCVPLKRVDAISVAYGLMEILSHTDIPGELVTDRSAVFMGKVCCELCRLLNIKHITTTAYHPQINGALERWHGGLKDMLGKLEDRLEQWDLLLKYCLFAYRTTPHAASGFPPFQLIHGRPLQGPLEAMKEGWVSGEMKISRATEWVNNLCETLIKLHEVAVFREYKHGEMVLLHASLLTGKLELLWKGPYEVSKRLSDTTYQLSVPEKRWHKVVAHVNTLKLWKAPLTTLFRVVVAQDSEGSDHPIVRVNFGEEEMTEEQWWLFQATLKKYRWTVESGSLGKAPEYAHVIATGESTPVHSHPYRIVPGWNEELKEEVMKLLKQGIIKPSQSPWSSPMVQVCTPNG